jgi:hypothetical protein
VALTPEIETPIKNNEQECTRIAHQNAGHHHHSKPSLMLRKLVSQVK